MSSSLARTRSLRKPAQGSTTDLPSTASGAPTQRPVSPSRLPGPRSAALAQEEDEPDIVASVTDFFDAPVRNSKPLFTAKGYYGFWHRSIQRPSRENVFDKGTCLDQSSSPSFGLDHKPRGVGSQRLFETDDFRHGFEHVHSSDDIRRRALSQTPNASFRPGSRSRTIRSNAQWQHRSPTAFTTNIIISKRGTETTPYITLRRPLQLLDVFSQTTPAIRNGPSYILEIPPLLGTLHTTSPSSEHIPQTTAQTVLPPTATHARFANLAPAEQTPPQTGLHDPPATLLPRQEPRPETLDSKHPRAALPIQTPHKRRPLHLLHRDLPSVTSQYHASAKSTLAARHSALAKSSRDLVSLESQAAEHRNVAALHKWASSSSSSSSAAAPGRGGALEHKIQHLDALLTTLWSLDAPGGKHHRLVRLFERWAATLPDLETARDKADSQADPSALLDANLDVRFGGGLDARWKEECAALVRRLEGWDRQLRDLEYTGEEETDEGGAAQVSSLKRMLDGCGSLVRDMLAELAVMEEIEKAAVKRETEWIRKMNRQGDDGRRDTPRAGAVWRVV
ncbi:hypothetical protein C8034_v004558 [Colletotrichum sidae]|uniref:Uncharacterized protein n=1 Tax=Colletotrichum sidae TaxID=1347389 RepID=A0A4V3I269_9PEZI|nr:hypothetical protein C8034_v004558 [Colletotrichum sidae]